MPTFSLRPLSYFNTIRPKGDLLWRTLTIENTTVVLKGKQAKSLFRHPAVTSQIPFENIANVSIQKNIVSFDLLRNGLIVASTSFRPRHKRDLPTLRALLPSTQTDQYAPELQAELQELETYSDALHSKVRIPFVSYALLTACLGAQAYLVAHGVSLHDPSAHDLLRFGGNVAYSSLLTQPWRLFTAAFLHGGLAHIIVNLYSLYQVGPLVERLYGHTLFALLYLGSLLIGSLASATFNDAFTVSVGASGALFGIFTAILAFAIRCKKSIPNKIRLSLTHNVVVCTVINLMYGLKVGIDNNAHIGGAIAGFLLGLIAATPLFSQKSAPKPSRRPTLLRILALLILIPSLTYGGFRLAQKHQPIVNIVQTCDAIETNFYSQHPEFFEDDFEPSPQFLIDICKNLYTAQIDFIDSFPSEKLSPNEQQFTASLRHIAHAYATASYAHLSLLHTPNPDLEEHVFQLYQKAHSLQNNFFNQEE